MGTVTEQTSGFGEEIRSTHATPSGVRSWFLAACWCVVVAYSLVLNALSIPSRYRQIVMPCTRPADAILGRRSVDEAQALADVGISPELYFWLLEGLASAWVVICLAFSVVIFWKRRDRVVAFLASTYLVVGSTAACINSPALAMEIPATRPLVDLHFGLGFALVVLLVLLLPNGRFEPRLTRWIALFFVTYQAARIVLPAVPGAGQLWPPYLAFVPEMAVMAFGVGVQGYRYRVHYSPIERQQTKWVVTAFAIHLGVWIALLIPNLVLASVVSSPLLNVAVEVVLYLAYMVTFLAVPVALMFAVLRHRLWDIDLIINRSLIYGLLSLSVLAVFVICFLGLHGVFTLALDRSLSPVVLAASTAVAGALFQPARRRLQRFVDRRFYGIGLDLHRRRRRPERVTGERRAIRARVLRRYEDVAMVGRGGMAEVFRGRDPRSDAVVAIKLLRGDERGEGEGARQQFEREAAILRDLRHPNIVPVHEVGTTEDGVHYIVMQYIEGRDLRQHLLRRERMSLGDALPILQDVAAALDHAHARGVVHRDVKLSNVLLETRPGRSEQPVFQRALLTDFGVAKPAGGPRLTNSVVLGTVGYMSPEQIEDAAEVDGRADIYSFGVLAYELLTGQRPFRQRNPTAVLIAQLHQPPQDPRERVPQIPAHAADAIMRALAKAPADRYPSAGEMMIDLLSEEPTEIFG